MADRQIKPSIDEQLKNDIEERINDSISKANKNREKYNKGAWWYFIYIIGNFLLIEFIVLKLSGTKDSEGFYFSMLPSFILSIPFGVVQRFIFKLVADGYYDSLISKLQRELTEEKRKLLKYGQDFFTNLVDINLKHIDRYYLQTQNQANKSFFLALFASICGLMLISVGVLFTYYASADSNNADAGRLATIAGVITEFISAVIFYLYSKTIASMADYHTKLVLTQNVSLALKSAENLGSEKKCEAVNKIISELTTDVNAYITKLKKI